MMKRVNKVGIVIMFLLNVMTMLAQEPADKIEEVVIGGPSVELEVELAAVQEITANDAKNGVIEIIKAVGGWGAGSYSYEWYKNSVLMNPQPVIDVNNKINGLEPGEYHVIIKSKTCEAISEKITFTNPPSFDVTATVSQSINCYGGTGTIKATVKGGIARSNGGYIVELRKSGNSTILETQTVPFSTLEKIVNFTGREHGTYQITVKDKYNEEIKTVSLIQPPVLSTPTATVTNVSCNGGKNGTVTISITGGTSPYVLTLEGSEVLDETTGKPEEFNTSISVSDLEAKTYTYIVKDKNGCQTSLENFTITQPPALNVSKITDGNPTFNNASDGFINIAVSGGRAGYSYQWYKDGSTTPFATTLNVSGLKAGIYKVRVTDANSCVQEFTDMVLTNPAKLEIQLTKTDIKCFGDNTGSIEAMVSGGASNTYKYEWFKVEGATNTTIGTNSNSITGLSIGTYKVKVTVLLNSVEVETNENTITLNQPIAPISIHKSIMTVSCKGGNDGSINLTVDGGTLPYTYSWSNGQKTQNIAGLFTGSYTVKVTDANNCFIEETYTVNEPSNELNVTYNSHQNPLAFGATDGSINISVSGGTLPYTYQWFNDGGNVIGTSQNITNIGDGTYRVLVTDAKGCTDELYQIITEPDELIATITIPNDGVLFCNGDTDGKMNVSVVGGIKPYRYHWYEVDGGGNKVFIADATAIILSGIGSGTYGVEVTDRDGSGVKANALKTMVNPGKVEIDKVTVKEVDCYGEKTGKITINVIGGTGSYIYKWYKVGEVAEIGTTNVLENLKSGDYKVVVTDSNNCPNPPIEKIISVTEPSELILRKDSQKNLTGFETANGEINIEEVSGGVSPYTYELRIKGATSIISSSNLTTGLSAGIYTMTIKDVNGCSIKKEYTLTQPDKLVLNLTVANKIACFGEKGTIGSQTTGGFLLTGTTYDYKWYHINDTTTIIGTSPEITVIAGIYKLVVTDTNGNTESKEIELTQNNPINIDYVSTNISCNNGGDGKIDITVTGGTGVYTFSWSNGMQTQDITNVAQGIYSVKVTDENGCQKEETITLTEPSVLTITKDSSKDLTGFEIANGEINIENVVGGTEPYSYELKLKGTTTIISTSNFITGLSAGTYIMTIVDAKGCTIDKEYVLQQPDKLEVSLTINKNIPCKGETGVLNSAVIGGYLMSEVTYSYEWYNISDLSTIISTNPTITTVAGTYRLVVTDSNGNIAFSQEELKENDLIEIAFTKTDITCFNGNDGSIDITVKGGTGVYTYDWNNGVKTEDINTLSAGIYSVKVTDENGCQQQETITINQPDEYKIQLQELTRPTGSGVSDGKIVVTVVGGVMPYVIEWKNESGNIISNTNTITNLPAGNYYIKVIDSKGCELNETYSLSEPDPLIASITQIQEIQCNGETSGILKALVTGGVGGNTFIWYNADLGNSVGTTETIYNLPAGNYYVKVTDFNGIETVSNTYTITEPNIIQVSANHSDLTCFESNNGTIIIETVGGTGNYFYRQRINGNAYSIWQSFTGSTILENLQAGEYDLQIKDSNDCYFKETNGAIKTINLVVTQPEILNLEGKVNNTTGFGLTNGSIEISVTGGTKPYVYEWKNSLGQIISSSKDLLTIGADTYIVKVIDSKGCFTEKEFIVNQPDKLEATIKQQNIVLCNNDNTANINSIVTGGIPPYKYQWYKEGNGNILSTANSLNNIGKGIYYVIVTDANDNTAKSANLNISEPEILEVTLQTSATGCGLNNDWIVISNVIGGTPPYTYAWSSGQNTSEITNVSLGSYFVLITDANGCQTSGNITLQNTTPLTIKEIVKDEICYKSCTGEIGLTIEGGLPPYQILWNTGETTDTISELCSGEYTVTITDQKGCQVKKAISIKDAEEFTFDLVPEEVTLCYGETIEYDVTMNNIASYSWESTNGFISDKSVVVLSEGGIYTLTVTTVDGCVVSKKIQIHKSETVIDAQLIVTSQAFVGEDIVIINVSNPISEKVEWEIPTNVTIVQKTNEGIVLRFPAPGNYDISLISFEGNCKKIATKKVNVLKARDLTDVGDSKNPFIKEFTVFSNPNKGKFKVNIELEKQAEISLRLFNLSANTIIEDKKMEGEKEYEITYDLGAPAGIYVLLLETPKARRIRKIVIE
ncbi:hypothetical protein ACQY1Q_02000 [Tenacibaculum sp. TC6]|uniref:hypothetical protein n=1 Tax=Tenacibaculum sp. TC6 TaxID=3423223 RepID=UPI003D3693DC